MPSPNQNDYGNRYAGGGSGGSGSGTVSDVTSSGGTITVTNPTGPTVNVDLVPLTGDVTTTGANVATVANVGHAGANDVSDASLLYLHQFYR